MNDLLVTGIGRLVTGTGPAVEDAVISIVDGSVAYAGPTRDAPDQGGASRLDCSGRAAVPGFVDCHTHLVFAGDRADEFAARLGGVGYAEIAAQGGGILSTVKATRAADEDTLFAEAAARVWRMIRSGTTALEIKSGYGLDTAPETRLLRVARRLGEELPITVRTTFLGAHSVPEEYRADRSAYVDLVCAEMIPAVAGLADFCDVFVEEGAFTVEEGRRVLDSGLAHGMRPRIHAEQLGRGGGAKLAAEIGALSADHLDHANEEDAAALAAAGVTAVLVPGASYTLRTPPAPARMLLDAGCRLALATDCNPGTSYFEGMGLVIGLAVVEMGLTTEEALTAATLGGAVALDLPRHGILSTGSVGDLVVLDAPNETHLPYRPATNLVWRTVRGGRVVHSAG